MFDKAKTISILMNGPAGSGKDYLTKGLINKFNDDLLHVNHLMFKDKLYEVCRAIYGEDVVAWCSNIKTKDISHPSLHKTGREILIELSEDFLKPLMGSNYFGIEAAKKLMPGVNIFSDSGFYQETIPIHNNSDYLFIIHITRDGCTFERDSRGYVHFSMLPPYGETISMHNAGKGQEDVDLLYRRLLNTGKFTDEYLFGHKPSGESGRGDNNGSKPLTLLKYIKAMQDRPY